MKQNITAKQKKSKRTIDFPHWVYVVIPLDKPKYFLFVCLSQPDKKYPFNRVSIQQDGTFLILTPHFLLGNEEIYEYTGRLKYPWVNPGWGYNKKHMVGIGESGEKGSP